MAPKIVDNEQKRLNIVYKAYDYILDFGIKDFSTTAFIKHYKMGKSSLYHYFKSKDEILHEIYYRLAIDELNKIESKIKSDNSLEEKLEVLFDFYLSDDLLTKKLHELYLEYLNIYTEKKDKKMREYDTELLEKFEAVLEKIFIGEIEKGNIKKESVELVTSLLATSDGMLIYSHYLDNFDLPKELRKYLKTIIKLIKN
jgi:AcrR family transcriptional regulator